MSTLANVVNILKQMNNILINSVLIYLHTFLFQVKIWFQNRRTKWKKQNNISNAEAAEHKNQERKEKADCELTDDLTDSSKKTKIKKYTFPD